MCLTFHPECSSEPDLNLDLTLYSLYSKKTAIETPWVKYKIGLKQQSKQMLENTEKKLTPVSVGDNVLLNIPEVGCGRIAPQNIQQ